MRRWRGRRAASRWKGEEEARRTRAQVIAAELVKTEAHYVAILHLIDQVSVMLSHLHVESY